ncbi:flavodoxin, partial [Streptococcus anginosus]|nr:flavodoxin [Streptococcus anginosus]
FILASFLEDLGLSPQLVGADAYDYETLLEADGLAIGSYTYGNHAEIPEELLDLYEDLPDLIQANHKLKQALAVFGSGDRDYPICAKAVDD